MSKILFSALPLIALVVGLAPSSAGAQNFNIDWYSVGGGGGTSTGGVFSVSGTIGQPDAGVAMSGGDYSLTSGLWSLVGVVQTPGAPMLTITNSGNRVTVAWPLAPSGFALQQNDDLANPAGWSAYAGVVSTNNGVNTITLSPPMGNLFYRLFHP